MDSLIRWKRGDYIKLGQAVSRFNKIINSLESDEINFLPDLKNYQEIKSHITSRKELNRVINSLRRVNEENLLKTKVLESGEEISKWEFQEMNKARKRAYRNLALETDVYTLGKPEISAPKINPFYIMPGVSPQVHIDYLKDKFDKVISFERMGEVVYEKA